MATRRHYRKNKRSTRRHKRGGKQSKSNSSLKRASKLHMAFGKQRALAFASH